MIQDRLKLTCPAFDVQAACAGFVFALVIAAQFVATGNSQCALVIGGDCNSRVINPSDQKSFPLFGDGAGAVVLAPGQKDQGLVAYQLGSDGSGGDLLSRPGCGSRIPPSPAVLEKGLHFLTMDGRAVFKWAVRILADSSQVVLEHAGCQVSQVRRWFVPHQANLRIIHAASDVLGFHRDAVYKNLEQHTETRPPGRSRSRSMNCIAKAASSAATCCSPPASAPASTGAPRLWRLVNQAEQCPGIPEPRCSVPAADRKRARLQARPDPARN